MIILKKSIAQINQIISDLRLDGEVDKKKLLDQMVSLENSMTLVNTQMKDIRLLFPSAKTRAKDISVLEVLEKVNRLYMRPLDKLFVPVFIFSGVDIGEVEDVLSEKGLYNKGKANRLFVKSKTEVESEEQLFQCIEEWLKEMPSIYAI